MTTPDKEVNPTTDRAAGPWTTDGRYIRASERGIVSDVIAIVDGRARMTNEANAQFIVTACNAYEPMREALDELANAARTYVNVTEREVIPEGDLLSTTAWHGLIECLHNAEKAHTALSTLPVNDRQTSDDVGILRKATAAIEDDDLRNDLADICTQALADAPEVLADPRGLDVLLDAIVCLFRDKARAALKGVPQPAKPEPEARIVTSHALPVTMWDSIATAVVKRVAELPDRSSPDNWPEAMLVTSEELHDIIMSEFDSEVG